MLSRFADWLGEHPLPNPLRYGLAVLVVLSCVLLRLATPLLGLPYLLFIPMLMLIGYVLGLGPGLLATLLTMLLANYLFVGEPYSLALTAEQWGAAWLFLLVNSGIVSVCSALRHSLSRLQGLTATLEQRVEERTRERDQIWEVSPDLVCTVTEDGRFLNLNPAWERSLGWSVLELCRRPFEDFLHEDDIPRTREAFHDVLSGKAVLAFENRYRHRDGSYRWLSWNSVQRNGLLYSTVRDVTLEKEQAEALRKAEELLRHSQKMDAVGQLTGGLAHDFNNLLTGITGSLDLVRVRLAQRQVDHALHYVHTAQTAASRAAALTHRLLAFSRRQTLDPKVTEPNRLVEGMLELIARTVGPAIQVSTRLQPRLWNIRCDPHQLENALLNLCINARDAMPEGGALLIATENIDTAQSQARAPALAPGEYVVISVTDSGIGMAPDVASRAFDPFFTTKPIGMGTGLGLSMIYGFTQQSGGQARIDSVPGEGTTVSLFLPCVAAEPAETPEGGERPVVQGDGSGYKVLVVDDEAIVRMLVHDVLEDLGYRVLEAAEGDEGLCLLREHADIDLLISDVGLPGMNGRQLADAARQLYPDLKVLFITGYAEHSVIGGGNMEPGMYIMTKPFALEKLVARIETVMAE